MVIPMEIRFNRNQLYSIKLKNRKKPLSSPRTQEGIREIKALWMEPQLL